MARSQRPREGASRRIHFPLWSVVLSVLVILGVSMTPRGRREGFQLNASTFTGTGEIRRGTSPIAADTIKSIPELVKIITKSSAFDTAGTSGGRGIIATIPIPNDIARVAYLFPVFDSNIKKVEYPTTITPTGKSATKLLAVHDFAAKTLTIYKPKSGENLSLIPEQLPSPGFVQPNATNSTSEIISIQSAPTIPNPDPLPPNVRTALVSGCDVAALKALPAATDSSFWKTEEERQRIIKLIDEDIAKTSGGGLAGSVGGGIASTWTSITGVWNGITSRPDVLYPVLGVIGVLLVIILLAKSLGRKE